MKNVCLKEDGETALWKMCSHLLSVGSSMKGSMCNLLPRENSFFFVIEPLSEGALCAVKETVGHEVKLSPLYKNLQVYPLLLNRVAKETIYGSIKKVDPYGASG